MIRHLRNAELSLRATSRSSLAGGRVRVPQDASKQRRISARSSAALAQRVEVVEHEVRIMGSRDELIRVLAASNAVESAANDVRIYVPEWRCCQSGANQSLAEFPVPQGEYRELSLFLRHSDRWMLPNRRKFRGLLAGFAIQWNRERLQTEQGRNPRDQGKHCAFSVSVQGGHACSQRVIPTAVVTDPCEPSHAFRWT